MRASFKWSSLNCSTLQRDWFAGGRTSIAKEVDRVEGRVPRSVLQVREKLS
jgi:hypothetical protein